jgi:hypothetical protein
MAYGLRAFRKIQISNPEDTSGTAEAATEILFGTLAPKASDELWHKPDQDRGVLAMNYETPFAVGSEIELEFEGELYDRLAVFLFSNAIRGNVTATQPDSMDQPNTYQWEFEPSMTAPNTPDQTNGIDTFTLEYGDNVQAYEVEHLYTVSVEITGAPDEPVTATWTVRGRQVSEGSFTGALSAPTIAGYFPFNLSQFYIEADAYDSIGSTQKTGMLRAFTWTFETQFTGRVSADGTLYFTGLNEDKKTVELELTYYRDDTNSAAEFDAYQAQSMRYMRIELLGDTEMDSGQDNPPYIYLDGAFRYTEWPELDDEDGTSVVTVTAQAFYDTTKANMMTCTVGTTMDAFAT